MTLLLLKNTVNVADSLVINATSTFCALSDESDAFLFEIDPVAHTLISTTTIAGMTGVVGVSPDGTYVFSADYLGNGKPAVWHSGSVALLPIPGTGAFPQNAEVTSASTDGTVPVATFHAFNDPGDFNASAAAFWASPYSSYGTYPGSGYATHGLLASDGGGQIVGSHLQDMSDPFFTIFKWTPPSTAVLLPVGPDNPTVFSQGISADGSTVWGSVYFPEQAAYWDVSNALTIVGIPADGSTDSYVFGSTDDGATLGVSSNVFSRVTNVRLYKWTVADGFIDLGFSDQHATMANGGLVMTATNWVNLDNSRVLTGLLGGRKIAADGRAGIGFLADSGVTDAYVYFPDTIPPAGPTILDMGHVIATSLVSESPCMAAQFSPPLPVDYGPALGLRWSDTRGATWGNPVPQPLSTDPLAQPIWNRTGYARDRVFELFWSFAFKTALNGAFVDVEPFDS